MVKIRDGVVANRPVYLAIGVDVDGGKQVLGMWIGPSTGESAKFWLSVLAELKTRGVGDVCIVCCDGLTGLPDAIGVIWRQAVAQLCVVHLIRASLRYASRKDWTALTQGLRPIYQAVDEKAASAALEVFAERWQKRYPAIVKLWRAHWAKFVPFLVFPPQVRRVIYTTNLIESMNARLRKVTRNRGQFPPNSPSSKCSTWPCGTWTNTAGPKSASAAPAGNKRCKRSPSTLTAGSPRRHDYRGHRRLHKESQ